MKIENTQVYGFLPSIKAMRNPMDSWELSDTIVLESLHGSPFVSEQFLLGEKDARLSFKLSHAGGEHAKHLRMIHVWVDMTLPRYIWSEFDTYKYNTKVSCSTMHKLKSRPLTDDDFENGIHEPTLDFINNMIELDTPIEEIKNVLPEGFLQRRTVCTNYAELLNIYKQRKYHKLSQWREICGWIESLPYIKEITNIDLL